MAHRGTRTARGYGVRHQQLRKQWAPVVALGQTWCTRYGHPLFPDCPGLIPAHRVRDGGRIWHLGHDDWDRSRYTGPEHAACNVRASNLIRDGLLNVEPRPRSRDW